METAVVDRVAELVVSEGGPRPGVKEILGLSQSVGWRVGLASNSPLRLCHLTLRALGIETAFDAVVSADFVTKGKPDPSVYEYAARALGVRAEDCIAFEDSISGVGAARAAGMTVVAVPSGAQAFDDAGSVPHIQIRTLSDFGYDHAVALQFAP